MIRLADRQGVLQGRSLSAVQQFANSYLLHVENKAAFEGRIDALKNVLIAADPMALAPELYPDLFPPDDLARLDLEEVPDDVSLKVVNVIRDDEVEDFLASQGIQIPDRHR
jgi:hypothetical protein